MPLQLIQPTGKSTTLRILDINVLNMEISDSGSHDEGIDIHLKKVQPTNMARSLPVNVPAFGHFDLQTVEFDSDALVCSS